MGGLHLFSLPSSRLLPSLSPFPSKPSPIHLNRRSARLHMSSPHSSPSTATPATPTPSSQSNQAPTSETFDWFAHWYPLAPICDLDKRAPRALTVLGLDVVIWWDRVEGTWKVFDDRCPHRLAPLSEGRVDPQGRLQCVYHGWCFDGAGNCKFIPQAPSLGPPVHKDKKACVAVYPSVEQNKILWFWPNTNPHYKDILHQKRPPYVPELDDPLFATSMGMREMPYGYEILIENLMDPAHVPYAHYGIMTVRKRLDPGRVETDREGGSPLEITLEKLDINGFVAKQDAGYYKFVAPSLFYFSVLKDFSAKSQSSKEENLAKACEKKEPRFMTIFMCAPVSPGKSRVMVITTRNFATWLDILIPRWYYHIGLNLVLDSDLYLLHVQECKLALAGISNWHKACYVPTQSDAMVIAFRRWLRKYSHNQVNWGTTDFAPLPPTPSRDQFMDRYWSHVVKCNACSRALKALQSLEGFLKIGSLAIIGIVAAAKHSVASNISKATLVAVGIVSFLASHLLSQFIRKTFYFHDYNHATVRATDRTAGNFLGSVLGDL